MKNIPPTKKRTESGFTVWPLFLSWTFQAATDGLSGNSSKGLFWRIGRGVMSVGDVSQWRVLIAVAAAAIVAVSDGS